MQVHVLASGSTGNAVFVKMGPTKILIDAGISASRIRRGLAAENVDIRDIDGVLVTHEHRDHVNGLPMLWKKYNLNTYTRPATWQALGYQETLPPMGHELPASLDIGQVKIEPFGISHDAADPVGFTLYYRDFKCSVATDLGFVTTSVKQAVSLSDVLVLEANHDVDMLKNGSYPWFLKQRILSNRGHLSNIDAGWILSRLARKNKTQVMLAHLSQKNNRPELACDTVSNILREQGCKVGDEVSVRVTYPDHTASIVQQGGETSV